MKEFNLDPNAWYSHFWPWFIVGLLGISIIASLYTVSIAYSLGDIEVPEEVRTTIPDPVLEAPHASKAAED